jgi:hypothetical protein
MPTGWRSFLYKKKASVNDREVGDDDQWEHRPVGLSMGISYFFPLLSK